MSERIQTCVTCRCGLLIPVRELAVYGSRCEACWAADNAQVAYGNGEPPLNARRFVKPLLEDNGPSQEKAIRERES